jgi:hypothetical protein
VRFLVSRTICAKASSGSSPTPSHASTQCSRISLTSAFDAESCAPLRTCFSSCRRAARGLPSTAVPVPFASSPSDGPGDPGPPQRDPPCPLTRVFRLGRAASPGPLGGSDTERRTPRRSTTMVESKNDRCVKAPLVADRGDLLGTPRRRFWATAHSRQRRTGSRSSLGCTPTQPSSALSSPMQEARSTVGYPRTRFGPTGSSTGSRA